MPTTAMHTAATDFRRVLAANSTTAAFSAPADATTAPVGAAVDSAAGYISLATGSLVDYTPNAVMLKFFGAGADNTTGRCRVWGVRAGRSAAGVLSYTHTLLAEYAFTLSAAVGVAGGVVTASERYADTITRTTGIENVSDKILSPTGDVAGHVVVDAKGHSLLLVDLVLGAGSPATSVNALWAGV